MLDAEAKTSQSSWHYTICIVCSNNIEFWRSEAVQVVAIFNIYFYYLLINCLKHLTIVHSGIQSIVHCSLAQFWYRENADGRKSDDFTLECINQVEKLIYQIELLRNICVSCTRVLYNHQQSTFVGVFLFIVLWTSNKIDRLIFESFQKPEN